MATRKSRKAKAQKKHPADAFRVDPFESLAEALIAKHGAVPLLARLIIVKAQLAAKKTLLGDSA
jgi:hypothetical protein